MTETAERPAAAKAIYRGMDRAALDAAYNNSLAVPDSAERMARGRERSAVVRANTSPRLLDVAYGSRPRERLDYFPSGATKPPLVVFIHGGYWQRNDKDMFAFLADGPRAHGIDVAVVGYTLAPDVRLTDIVAEMHQALTFLSERADDFGFDRNRLFVAGWSAGGHLTATTSSHPAFRGGIPISGIFDLEPIALNYLNEKLLLDPTEVATLSPLRVLPDRMPPLKVFVGGNETSELVRQSTTYAEAARERALPVTLTVMPGHNHFTILDEISRPEGAITRALVELIASVR
jgi:arylformamidase